MRVSSAPLDPGGNRPNVPLLQGGKGSSPPPAKFRELRGLASSPAAEASQGGPAVHGHLSGPRHLSTSSRTPPASIEGAGMSTWSTASHQIVPHSELTVPGSGASTPQLASPGKSHEHGQTELPLRLLTLQQQRGAGESNAGRSRQRSAPGLRSIAGGAHAAAGSPSPEREHVHDGEADSVLGKMLAKPSLRARSTDKGARQGQLTDERPSGRVASAPEDKYLKILQNLQAKGAAGARGKLLEGAGIRDRSAKRLQALGDSGSLSRTWTPQSRSSPVLATSKPTQRRRLAADSESDDSVQ